MAVAGYAQTILKAIPARVLVVVAIASIVVTGGAWFLRLRLEESRYNQRVTYWRSGLEKILQASLPPSLAKKLLEEMGGEVTVSPADPLTGRFKLDVQDDQMFDFEMKGYTIVYAQAVYGRSGKPISYTVRGVIVPR